MPRPKVVPEDRQRVERACQPCQASKKRCDGKSPCSLCIKHERQDVCAYGASARGSRTAPYPTPQRRRTVDRDDAPTIAGAASQGNGSSRKNSSRDDVGSKGAQFTTNQMMVNSKGERVFLGETASLSFLQFLRQILRQHIGPSRFTEASSNVMLEAQSPEANAVELVEDLDLQRNFIQYYLAATSGLLALHTHASVESLLSQVTAFDHRFKLEQAESLLAMAIGAQARGKRLDSNYAQAYFDRGRQLAFEGMLENPSHGLVRLFLLMAFYMLGACQRNAACLYLGIAAKTASIIGLHDESQYKVAVDADAAARLCTWNSLKTTDILVNTILGRPTSFSPPHSSTDEKSSTKPNEPTTILDATYQLSMMIEEFTAPTKGDPSSNLGIAEKKLQRIRTRMNSFPNKYRSIKVSDLTSVQPDELAGMIGNVHLACVYYFAVILISRPYLMTSIVTRMRSESSAQAPPKVAAESSQMAEACVDAAIFLATMAKGALNAGILLSNMCILKAWIFLAGLVLGFAICTQVDERTDVEDAFSGAREVLAMFAVSSPQAQEYHDILGLFAEAIRRYREQAAQNRMQKNRRYVDQVLSFETNDPIELEQPYLTPNSGPVASTEFTDFGTYPDMMSTFDPTFDANMNFGDFGGFASQINDFFPFDYDSLGLGFE